MQDLEFVRTIDDLSDTELVTIGQNMKHIESELAALIEKATGKKVCIPDKDAFCKALRKRIEELLAE